jgi:hypothetical protein
MYGTTGGARARGLTARFGLPPSLTSSTDFGLSDFDLLDRLFGLGDSGEGSFSADGEDEGGWGNIIETSS